VALNLGEKLSSVLKKIGLKQAGLTHARERHKHHHGIAVKAYRAFEKHTDEATKLRKEKKLEAAKVYDRRAVRALNRSQNASREARKWVGHIKDFIQQINDLEVTAKRLRERIKKISGVSIKGNKATGGDAHKRLQKAALASAAACASGRRHNFYSQSGPYDVDHCITGPPYGHRDDCSSWFASVYKTCGLPDPSGQGYGGGFTGTLEAHGKLVSIEFARNNPGCAILYGNRGATHHVEFSIGDGTDHTIGHGSAPVDMGIFNLFGDGNFRCYKYALS
jgi:hypothetical protein